MLTWLVVSMQAAAAVVTLPVAMADSSKTAPWHHYCAVDNVTAVVCFVGALCMLEKMPLKGGEKEHGAAS